MKSKMDMKAYRQNIRKACAAMGNRIPNGYSTRIAPNGDFIVDRNGTIFGRLTDYAPFIRNA